jgi:hypothetical protein
VSDRIPSIPQPSRSLPGVLRRLPAALAAWAAAAGALAAQHAPPPVVRAVVVERDDVFAGAERGALARLANALHVRTRASVVERELLLAPGDRWDPLLAAESARNLRALRVFSRVEVDSAHTDSGLVLRVRTRDGWSTWPVIDFATAGDESRWTLGVTEENLLGTAATAALSYTDDPDRTIVAASWYQPRLFARRGYLSLGYQDRSDGQAVSLSGGQAYTTLAAPWGAALHVQESDGTVFRWRAGRRDADADVRRAAALVRVEASVAPRASARGYLRLGVLAQLRRDDTVSAGTPAAPLARTMTAAAGLTLDWRRARYLVTRNYRSFARAEDVDLGTALRLAALAAPRGFGYDDDGLGLSASGRAALRLPGESFAVVAASAGGRFTTAGLDSGTVLLDARAVLRGGRGGALVLAAEGGARRRPPPGGEFDLGLGVGPRAFGAHAFTGDRYLFVAAEARWAVVEELGGLVGVGLAAFAEHGGAWFDGEPRRTGTDVGAGLRLGPSRTAAGSVLRIDLARRLRRGEVAAAWVLSVGEGLTF